MKRVRNCDAGADMHSPTYAFPTRLAPPSSLKFKLNFPSLFDICQSGAPPIDLALRVIKYDN